MKKILGFLFFIFVFSFLFVGQAFALDNLRVECFGNGTSCDMSGTDPLFSSSNDGKWYPGRILTKTITLKNSAAVSRTMAIKGTRVGDFVILEDKMGISIAPLGGGPFVWSGGLKDFYDKDRIELGDFNAGAELTYNFTASMESLANNDYQGLTSTFDLTLGMKELPVEGAGGPSLGGGVSAPGCSDQAPQGAPILLSASVTGPNQVTLTWSEGSGPLTYYLVAFGTTSGVMLYGNPNAGGGGTTSYIVSELSGGTKYYFKVRAGNGCQPGPFSDELSDTPGGAFIKEIPSGFAQGVLGLNSEEATPSSLTASTSGPGVFGIDSQVCSECIWWQLLLLEALSLLIYYSRFAKKVKLKRRNLLAAILPIIVYLIFININKGCFSNSFFCRYFWLLDITVFLLFIFWRRRKLYFR